MRSHTSVRALKLAMVLHSPAGARGGGYGFGRPLPRYPTTLDRATHYLLRPPCLPSRPHATWRFASQAAFPSALVLRKPFEGPLAVFLTEECARKQENYSKHPTRKQRRLCACCKDA